MESNLLLIGFIAIAFLFGLLVGQNWRKRAFKKAMSEAAIVLRAIWGFTSNYLKGKHPETITGDEAVLWRVYWLVYDYLTKGDIPINAPEPVKDLIPRMTFKKGNDNYYELSDL